MEHLKEFFKKNPNAKILDVGTGRGNFIALIDHLYKDYQEIIGIDIVDGFVKAASKDFEENKKVKFENRDILDTGYEKESFDIVCLSNSLHHLADIKTMFEAMEALVKPGGYLLFNEMMKDHLNEQQISHQLLHHFSAKMDRANGLTHNETYNRADIINTIQQNTSFSVVDSWDMVVGENTITEEQIESFAKTVDFLIARLPEAQRNQYLAEGEEIKSYIMKNGVEACTQLLVIAKKPINL